MVRAGQMPLDRAHAHARWAERYDAQSDPRRAAAHFGRAMHYAQMVQAFGAPKRESEEGSGDIVVGRVEDGAEVWSTLQNLSAVLGYSERREAATKKRRINEALRGHGDVSSRKRSACPSDMLDKLYASESSGIMGSVHSDTEGLWHIHRSESTGIVYLVPDTRLAAGADGVRDLVAHYMDPGSAYKDALSEGLLIVQDQRPGSVQVKRGGAWEPATKFETFAYYDFLLRYPQFSHSYHSEKRARELDEELSKLSGSEVLKSNLQWLWTTFPSAYASEQNEAPRLSMSRNGTYIFAGNADDPVRKHPARISDVAWRLPMCSQNEDF